MSICRVPPRVAVPAALLVLAIAATVTACGDDGSAGNGATGEGSLPDSAEAVPLLPLGDSGEGAPERLGDLLGDKPIVLNFFASWCAPCIEEMPRFEVVHQDLGDRVTFLGMAETDGEERALDVVETTGVTYPTYNDPDGDAMTFFKGTGMPTTVFISAGGDVLDTHSGELTEKELRSQIDQHFGVT